MGNNDLKDIKEGISILNNNLMRILATLNAEKIANSINEMKKSIDIIKEKESEILNQIKEKIEKQNEERNRLNSLIIKRFIPIGSLSMLFFFVFTYWLWDKSRESVLYPLSILGISAVSIIGLIIALAIINRRED
jgi:cation transport ATPase